MKTIVPILFVALACSACTTSYNRPDIGEAEIAAEAALPPGEVDQTVRYTNLCTRKECDPIRLEYSRTFRDIALLRGSIDQLETYLLEAATRGATLEEIDAAQGALPHLIAELNRARLSLSNLDPEFDFETVSMQIVARRALIAAWDDLDASRQHLAFARHALAPNSCLVRIDGGCRIALG